MSRHSNKPVKRFTVEEYHRMIEAGILTKDDKVELLEGWIVARQSPRSPIHDATVTLGRRWFQEHLPEENWTVRCLSAVSLADSEPEPDLAIVRMPDEPYFVHHPFNTDIGLIVEIADWTLETDRELKGRIYARADIPVYWIVNLIDRQIEVYTSPISNGENSRYENRTDYKAGETVPLVLDQVDLKGIRVNKLVR